VTHVIAHRGASAAAPGNTLAAFRLAVEMGADAIELDVRRTRDGRLVVHHDARLADGSPVVDLDRRDLPEHVPDLGQALDACAGAWVNVEIKNDETEPDFDAGDTIAADVARTLAARHEPRRWLVSSFRLQTIDALRGVDAGIATAWLIAVVPDGLTSADLVDQVVAGGHTAVHPWVGGLGRQLVRECHSVGLVVNTWTCDDPARMRELVGWGVDGICTNVPDVALRVRTDG
jgi:glycerophosphoryl diester phosphodiesterase